MALRSDRPSCMEKKQRDVLAKQVACGFGRFEWSVWKYWFWGKLFFSGGGGGCPFEKNAEFSWIFGFFVGLKFARESEGWTQELRPKESTAQEVPSEKCRGECPPSNTKKKNWPFSKWWFFLPPSIQKLRCDLEFSSTTALGSWRQTYRRLLGLKAARSGKWQG